MKKRSGDFDVPADTTTASTNPNADIRDIASVMKYLLSRCQEQKLVGPFNMTICSAGGRTFTYRVTERENADPEIVLLHAFAPVPFTPPASILVVDNEGSTRLITSGVSHGYWPPRGEQQVDAEIQGSKMVQEVTMKEPESPRTNQTPQPLTTQHVQQV